MAAMAGLISRKIWFLFIALTVVVVVGSATSDLLESMDCLLRDYVRYFTNADRNKIDSVRNKRPTGKTRLISSW